jgi:formate hydrogenlyase transcriptional activator
MIAHGTALQAPIAELGNSGRNTPVSVRYEADDRHEIVRLLRVTSGRVGGPDGAAARMGIKRTTLISRMKKLGIDPRKIS